MNWQKNIGNGSGQKIQKLIILAAMLFLSLIWGGTFAGTKFVLQEGVSVGALLSIRFILGGLFLSAIMLLFRKPFDRRSIADGLVLGAILVAIFWLQVDGLRFTTVSKSGFITGLVVIFTPMVSLLLGDRFRLSHALGAMVACAGLYFLVHDPFAPFGGWNRGDTETLVCAVLCGFHVALTARFSRRSSPWVLALGQISVVAILSSVLTVLLPAYESAGQSMAGFAMLGSALSRPEVWYGILYLALLATALGFFLQPLLQAKLTATEAAIIFTTEPVFAAALAVSGIIPGIKESLTSTQIFGGAMIVGAMLLAELGPRLKEWISKPK
jgi:drug/metabolite transporter (DMT)-like permease